MNITTTNQHKNHITVGQLEKERGLELHARKDMKVSTYLSQKGLPELGKLLEKIESK